VRGKTIELTGDRPTIYLADQVTMHVSSKIMCADGTVLTPGIYSANTHPMWISGKGRLVVEEPK
jgi:hypothetical protein